MTPQTITDLATSLQDLDTIHARLTDVLKQLQPPPPPPPPPPPINAKLAALQAQFGSNKVGVYTGIETVNYTVDQFGAVAAHLREMGADFGLVKMGEGGRIWHAGDFASIRNIFHAHGLGCGAYWYCIPQGGQAQVDQCVQLAQKYKLLILDCEDEYAGHDAELQHLLLSIQLNAPDAVIIVSGYGDPLTRFGPHGWPFHTVETSAITAYQPQAYFGVWDRYTHGSVEDALQWCDNEVGAAFGANMVIQPAINILGVRSLDDFERAGRYWKPFRASVVIWEYRGVTSAIIERVKRGLA